MFCVYTIIQCSNRMFLRNSDNICIEEIIFFYQKTMEKDICSFTVTTFVFKSNTCEKWQSVKTISLQIYGVIFNFSMTLLQLQSNSQEAFCFQNPG